MTRSSSHLITPLSIEPSRKKRERTPAIIEKALIRDLERATRALLKAEMQVNSKKAKLDKFRETQPLETVSVPFVPSWCGTE